MNEQFEKLRQVIIAANPEIMEWRCEGCNRRYAEYVNGCVQCWCDELPREDNLKIFPNRSVKLSPREIRLADVLLTIDKVQSDLCLSPEGQLMTYYPETGHLGLTGIWWDLRHDDLDWHYRNKPETVQFLIYLLCKN